MEAVDLAILVANIALAGISAQERYEKLKTGISANAQAQGRDVTVEEEQFLDAILEQSKNDRDGTD